MASINRLVVRLIIAALLFIIPSAQAQYDLIITYSDPDTSFQFDYPDSFTLDDSEPNLVLLSGVSNGSFLSFIIFNPQAISAFAAPNDTVLDLAATISQNFPFIQDDAESNPIGLRAGARARVTLEGTPGFAYVVEMGAGGYGLLTIIAENIVAIDSNEALISNILMSYHAPGYIEPLDILASAQASPAANAAAVLTIGASRQATLLALQENGYISSVGQLVFEENMAFAQGQGQVSTPLGWRSPQPDVVVSGELIFTSGSQEPELCSLSARVLLNDQSDVETFLDVGIDNQAHIYYIDRISSDEIAFESRDIEIDYEKAQHIVFIASGEQLTIFFNGVPVFENLKIQNRTGIYGISLLGQDSRSRCEGRNIWVSHLPRIATSTCGVMTAGSVNVYRRSGPGTQYARADVLKPGQRLLATAYYDPPNDFRWWELEDSSWVRNDVIRAEGNCDALPAAID